MSKKTDIEQLYTTCFTPVFRYLIRLTRDRNLSEELTQQTFFKAIQKADSFHGEGNVKTWLIQIAKNSILSICGKIKLSRRTNSPKRFWMKASPSRRKLQIMRARCRSTAFCTV